MKKDCGYSQIIVPLALAAPAALAGLAYLNAKLSLSYDYQLLGAARRAYAFINRREKEDRLNMFYILEEHAQGKFANETFIMFEGKKWTFKQTYDIVLKYGTWLKNTHNVKPEEIVAMDFTNSDNYFFLWFGIWSIGAKPAFINYNLTGKALSHCVKVSTARLCIVDPVVEEKVTQEVRDELLDTTFQILTPDIEATIISTEGVREPDSTRHQQTKSKIGTLIYTSGTTGLPKPAIMSWGKANFGSTLMPRWSGYNRPDVLYTVRSLQIFILCKTNPLSVCQCIIPPLVFSLYYQLSIWAQQYALAGSFPQGHSGRKLENQRLISSNMSAKFVGTSYPPLLNTTL